MVNNLRRTLVLDRLPSLPADLQTEDPFDDFLLTPWLPTRTISTGDYRAGLLQRVRTSSSLRRCSAATDRVNGRPQRSVSRFQDSIRPPRTRRGNGSCYSSSGEACITTNLTQMFETIRDEVFPFIKALGRSDDDTEDSTYATHMKDALFVMPSARVLANVVDQLDAIDMTASDTKGDLRDRREYRCQSSAGGESFEPFRSPLLPSLRASARCARAS